MFKTIKKEDCHEDDIKIIFNEIGEINYQGVIHLGAHKGEEVNYYKNLGFKNIVLIEANPKLCDELNQNKEFDDIQILNYAVSDKVGSVDFFIHQSNNGIESSSIFKMDKFDKIVTSLKTNEIIKVPSNTLSNIFIENNININDYNVLISDIQGADYFALLGSKNIIDNFDAIVVEVQYLALYENYVPIEKFDELLSPYGFKKKLVIQHELYQDEDKFPGWGELVYVKNI